MDPITSRRRQGRSHSMSGQEFHSNGVYQHRLKQSMYPQQGALDGYHNQPNGNRMHQIPSPYQQYQLNSGRSPSPLSFNCQTQYGSSQRDSLNKYSNDGQPKSQFHASSECLNTNYPDYHHQLQQQQHHIHHQHIQQHIQNKHYAASYVLATTPTNAVVNQNVDQDLAAAAMRGPQSQCHSMAQSASPNTNLNAYSQTQNLVNRVAAQVSQSPLKRIGFPGGVGASSNILNHLSSTQHPIRAGHSSLSLASSSFIVEDKLQNDIKKLQDELKSEREKNEALNNQLKINSDLMAAFEQSLTTLNTRLRQLTTLNEKKDNEIEDLKEQLNSSNPTADSKKDVKSNGIEHHKVVDGTESEKNLMQIIDELKRQLIEKDRRLTESRLEALSAAHQLEQLESKMSGESSTLTNEDDLDEGVMITNQSPSDSGDAITDSALYNEIKR